jgi:hypothetical protein
MTAMNEYFEFEVTLCRITPRIWRRFLLRSRGATFLDLHEAIRDACGWERDRFFLFSGLTHSDEIIAGFPRDMDVARNRVDRMVDEMVPPANGVELSTYFDGSEDDCAYEYDLGDGWLHHVDLVRTVALPETFERRLVVGARAFPPQNSGGIRGYERLVEFVKTGRDRCGDDPDELRKWLDGWKPDGFDLVETRKAFDRPRTRAPKGPRLVKPAEAGSGRKSRGRGR